MGERQLTIAANIWPIEWIGWESIGAIQKSKTSSTMKHVIIYRSIVSIEDSFQNIPKFCWKVIIS